MAGASARDNAYGNQYLSNLRGYGFAGTIYCIHPTASMIDSLPAYLTLGALPEVVDYAFISVTATQVPALLAQADGKVRFAQVMSSGFGEGPV